MTDIEEKALEYLKANKQEFFKQYISDEETKTQEHKTAIFTAGTSGAGKTEYADDRKSKEPFLLHIDIDSVRDFFTAVGYDGSNASQYQKPSSKGVNWLFDRATKKGYSLIMDSNFAEATIAQNNIKRLLDKEYLIEINYIYRDLHESYEFAKKRESVTKRHVPMEVVVERFKSSFDTTLFVKNIFTDSIILNLLDRKNNKVHDDIDAETFFEILSKEILCP